MIAVWKKKLGETGGKICQHIKKKGIYLIFCKITKYRKKHTFIENLITY